MKYILEYKNVENHNLNNTLFIYDFGYIKGFLYEDNFTMYRIVSKNDNQEIIEEYNGMIPKNAFSIETYKCEYKNTIYKTSDFDFVVTPFLKADSLPFEPSFQTLSPQQLSPHPLSPQQLSPHPLSPHPLSLQQLSPQVLLPRALSPQQLSPQQLSPQQLSPHPLSPQQLSPQQLSPQQLSPQAPSPVHQGLQQKKHAYKKRNSHENEKVYLNEVNTKRQPEDRLKQTLLIHQNAVIQQWTSLEQLMKGPLTLTAQVHQKQEKQLKPHSSLLKKKPFVSSQVRPHQVKVEPHVQHSTNLN